MTICTTIAMLAALTVSAAAQQPTTVTLGTTADPCVGGAVASIAAGGAVRYGDFSCTFPVPVDGLWSVELDFLEPCYQAAACAGGQVSGPGQRMENVYVGDLGPASLQNFDIFASGATDSTAAARKVLQYSVAGKISVRVQTVRRSGVLAAVVLQPVNLAGLTVKAGTGLWLTITGLHVSVSGEAACSIEAPSEGSVGLVRLGDALAVLWLPVEWCPVDGEAVIGSSLTVSGACSALGYAVSGRNGRCQAVPFQSVTLISPVLVLGDVVGLSYPISQ